MTFRKWTVSPSPRRRPGRAADNDRPLHASPLPPCTLPHTRPHAHTHPDAPHAHQDILQTRNDLAKNRKWKSRASFSVARTKLWTRPRGAQAGPLTSVSRAPSCAGNSSTSMATPVLAALREGNFAHNNEEDDQRVYVYKHPVAQGFP